MGISVSQLVTGERVGRTHDQEITLFNSVGLAIQDIATASMLLDIAEAEHIGLRIDL